MKASLPAFKALLLVRDCMEASSEAARTFALHMLSCPARKDWRREAKSAAYFFLCATLALLSHSSTLAISSSCTTPQQRSTSARCSLGCSWRRGEGELRAASVARVHVEDEMSLFFRRKRIALSRCLRLSCKTFSGSIGLEWAGETQAKVAWTWVRPDSLSIAWFQ
jgi:hypothetical protein